MFLEGCIEFVSSALILPLCCLNLHNHLIILHCFAYRDCALKTMSWATEGPSCFQTRASPSREEGTQLPVLPWLHPCTQGRTCPDSISGNWNARAGQRSGTACHQPLLLGWTQGTLFNSCQHWISSLAFPQPAWHRFLDSWNTTGARFLSVHEDSSSALFLILHTKDKTPWWIRAPQQLARLQMGMPWSFTFKAQNMLKC